MNSKLKQMIGESNFFDRRKNILEYYNTSDLKVEGIQEEIKAELVAADQKAILDSFELETGNGVEDYLTEEARNEKERELTDEEEEKREEKEEEDEWRDCDEKLVLE